MLYFWLIVYNLLFPFFWFAFFISGFFNTKVKASLNGRKDFFKHFHKKLAPFQSKTGPRLWVHASSVGEFEQARPIIQQLRTDHRDLFVLVTFSSISGYQARKNSPDADLVSFIPLDFYWNAQKFLALVKPNIFLLVRYDFWFNHLYLAKKQGTILYLIAATLRESSDYTKPVIKGLYNQVFGLFDHVFTVKDTDKERFKQIFHLDELSIAGDPRFDQVIKRSQNTQKIGYLEPFYQKKKVWVAGSTWPEDESLIIEAYDRIRSEHTSLIIAPHEVHAENIRRLQSNLIESGLSCHIISDMPENFDSNDVLIINQIGFLAELYCLADIAYVGGGFGVNVHNTLEAAVYGLPIIYGPNIKKSIEAFELAELGGGFIIHNQAELSNILQKNFLDAVGQQEAGKISREYVEQMAGATGLIVRAVSNQLNERQATLH